MVRDCIADCPNCRIYSFPRYKQLALKYCFAFNGQFFNQFCIQGYSCVNCYRIPQLKWNDYKSMSFNFNLISNSIPHLTVFFTQAMNLASPNKLSNMKVLVHTSAGLRQYTAWLLLKQSWASTCMRCLYCEVVSVWKNRHIFLGQD